MVRPSYDVNERRNRERSLFGLTDKRAPTPLKYVLSWIVWILLYLFLCVICKPVKLRPSWRASRMEATSAAHAQ